MDILKTLAQAQDKQKLEKSVSPIALLKKEQQQQKRFNWFIECISLEYTHDFPKLLLLILSS